MAAVLHSKAVLAHLNHNVQGHLNHIEVIVHCTYLQECGQYPKGC